MGQADKDADPKFGIVNMETMKIYGVYGRYDRRELEGAKVESWQDFAQSQGRDGSDIWADECYICDGKGRVHACYGCNMAAHPRCLVRKTLPKGLKDEEELLCTECTTEALKTMPGDKRFKK
jgi:hypothetical protein